MSAGGQLRTDSGHRLLAIALLTSLVLAGCARGVAGPSPTSSASLAPTAAVSPAPGGVLLNCGGSATTVHGWAGTVSWEYHQQRDGTSTAYSPEERQSVSLAHAADLSTQADDVEIYPGPDGSPLAANWFASRITGSASVDDQSICSTCDTADSNYVAHGTGAPLTEGPEGRAGRDPNFSNFVLSIYLDQCKYGFRAWADVAGVNTQHPGDTKVHVGQAILAYDPSPNMRLIAGPDLILAGSGSFPVAYDGYPAAAPNEDVLSLGGLSGDVASHGLGESGDSHGSVSWRLTPILEPGG